MKNKKKLEILCEEISELQDQLDTWKHLELVSSTLADHYLSHWEEEREITLMQEIELDAITKLVEIATKEVKDKVSKKEEKED
jgi:hypothetical protein